MLFQVFAQILNENSKEKPALEDGSRRQLCTHPPRDCLHQGPIKLPKARHPSCDLLSPRPLGLKHKSECLLKPC